MTIYNAELCLNQYAFILGLQVFKLFLLNEMITWKVLVKPYICQLYIFLRLDLIYAKYLSAHVLWYLNLWCIYDTEGQASRYVIGIVPYYLIDNVSTLI